MNVLSPLFTTTEFCHWVKGRAAWVCTLLTQCSLERSASQLHPIIPALGSNSKVPLKLQQQGIGNKFGNKFSGV